MTLASDSGRIGVKKATFSVAGLNLQNAIAKTQRKTHRVIDPLGNFFAIFAILCRFLKKNCHLIGDFLERVGEYHFFFD
jgi:hypothetical protein